MNPFRRFAAATLLASCFRLQAAAVDFEIPVSAVTSEVESDWTSIYYGKPSLLFGNDGSAETGGWRAWDLDSPPASPLKQVHGETPGRRTKIVTTIHGRDGKKRTGLAVSIAQPDSVLRAWELPGFKEVKSARRTILGDWSALCSWKSQSGGDYVYLFGKKEAKVFFVRKDDDGDFEDAKFIEVQTFPVPFEASGCATSPSLSKMFLSADDDKNVYTFDLAESTAAPAISKVGEAEDDVTGVAAYVSDTPSVDYLFVASKDTVAVYSPPFNHIGNLKLAGHEDIEIQGLSVYQGSTTSYPSGVLAYAIEAEDITGFGVSSLDGAMQALGLKVNTKYDPSLGCTKPFPICSSCSGNGFCTRTGRGIGCSCFAGWQGRACRTYTCEHNCSGNGRCVGPNECKCNNGWGGLHCSFVVVQPVAETDANGGDGDDPAIWISPTDRAQSRIITTTKSEQGAGLGVFDLSGKLLQTIPAGEPNNVDVIYNFQAGPRKIDLAYAACREDNTLCLFEITPHGTLTPIPGGIQPTPPSYEVYGSCTYRSPTTGKQYLFVNSKTSQYLQYELSSLANGTLTTTLIRSFFAGSGGQVEGCVADEQNGRVFIGEEPRALWRYDAEPGSSGGENPTGVAVATVGDGQLRADVEGVTLVYGKTKDEGFIIVSTQGVSAYNVYRRKAPHEFVMAFTIGEGERGGVDAVSNTDGIAAVGTGLGGRFPNGLVVVHDDANELAGGKGTSAEASFKLVPLERILAAEVVRKGGLMEQVDSDWNPRA